MSSKYSASNITVTQQQPKLAEAPGIISVRGVNKMSAYIEPAALGLTGYVVRPGYYFTGAMSLDASRCLYSSVDTVTVTNLDDSGLDLITARQDNGRFHEWRVPAGADKAYLYIESTTGAAVNYQLGSS